MILQNLVRDAFLELHNPGRGAVYCLPGASIPKPEEVFGAGSEQLGVSFAHLEPSSAHLHLQEPASGIAEQRDTDALRQQHLKPLAKARKAPSGIPDRADSRKTSVSRHRMSDDSLPQSEFILYQTEDGRTRIQCRFENETLWLTQIQIAELFQTTVPNINLHLKAIYAEGELTAEATIKSHLIVRFEGARQVSRPVLHYNLGAILAVGFRVRSHRGTQFRQWATARLSEYLVKGFTMDDERLKNPSGKGQKDYFDELLERIRDIRSSERRFYQKVLDIYATSVDYTPDAEVSHQFFAAVQNKMHWATHGHTAAEIIHQRADAEKPLMGLLTTRPGGIVRKEDVSIAKNYLMEDELQVLNRIVNLYVEYAELQALERKPMAMRDWITKLDDFLKISGRELLDHAGKISADAAKAKAELGVCPLPRFAGFRAASGGCRF